MPNLASKLGIQQVQIPSVPFANLWFSRMVNVFVSFHLLAHVISTNIQSYGNVRNKMKIIRG